jgi:hypothetical protein
MSYTAEQKDHYRVANLYGRAQGDGGKVLSLARNMANAIKDPKKACRRGDAAWAFAWHGLSSGMNEAVARLFYMRAIELSGLDNDSRARHEWDNKLNGIRPRHPAARPAPAPETRVERNDPTKRKIRL